MAVSGQSPSCTDFEEEDIEEEFKELELAVGKEALVPEQKNALSSAEDKEAEFINDAFSKLKLSDDLMGSRREKASKNPEMEAA